jgi:hypothetical protein
MFYNYRQNNSGGYWIGPKNVIVEADSSEEADEIAQQNGVYFDGISSGNDCSCCGDRWSRAWDDGDEKPEIYGENAVPSDDCVIVFKN